MSLKMAVRSPNKKEIARILRAFADLIEAASNQMVNITIDLTFEIPKES